jgi:putative glutamine amidotransferase
MDTAIVLVATDRRMLDGLEWSATPLPYLDAAAEVAGVLPLQLPSLSPAADLSAALAVADGVLLTGARSNVQPARYGAAATPVAEPHDAARDATTLDLIRLALDRGVPLLAICRGFQELNVALGGSLHPAHHERPGRMDHRGAQSGDMDEKFRLSHEVELRPGGTLAAILGAGMVEVNSVHRQAVDRLSERLVVEAEAPDGTVEAVSVAGASGFALGVQWHPEYWAGTDAPSAAIFRAFGEAVRAHRAHRLAATAQRSVA